MDLQRQNAELATKAKVIKKDEAGDEDEDEEEEDLPVAQLGKQKAADTVVNEDREDELQQDEVNVKQAKFVSSGLLNFEGPVSVQTFFNFSSLLTNSFVV